MFGARTLALSLFIISQSVSMDSECFAWVKDCRFGGASARSPPAPAISRVNARKPNERSILCVL